MCWRFRRTTNS
uniref:Uncharacterized protein n=1 Tax=Arundo donax TaxID=35708 RepID=A0A0A8YSY8_ARUDO